MRLPYLGRTIIPAIPGYYAIETDKDDPREDIPPEQWETIIAWRMTTYQHFQKTSPDEVYDVVEPLGHGGDIVVTGIQGIIRPDGVVEVPGDNGFANVREFLAHWKQFFAAQAKRDAERAAAKALPEESG